MLKIYKDIYMYVCIYACILGYFRGIGLRSMDEDTEKYIFCIIQLKYKKCKLFEMWTWTYAVVKLLIFSLLPSKISVRGKNM